MTKWEDLESDAMYALGGINGELEDVDGTMDGMAENMEKTFGQRMQKVWREAKGALAPFGEVMLDLAEDVLPKVSSTVESVSNWFSDLSPEAKNATLIFGGLAAAVGPVLVGVGSLIGVLGGAVTALAPVATAIAGAGGLSAALGTAGGAIAAFATGPVGIAIAAIAGIGIAGVALVNHLKKDAIPEVDRFGEHVSDSTKEALGGFFELSDGASQELMDLRINGTEVTELMADEILSKFEDMNAQILDGMKKRHADELAEMETQFMNSSALSTAREEEILRQQEIRNEMKVAGQEHFESRIQEIIEEAATEKRELTKSELNQIDSIRQEMNENAVVYLTENEREQKIIMERMKNQAGEMSALQAAEVVKNSAGQRDKVIADSEQQYNDTLAFAIQQRDETGVISAEEAEAIITEAKKKRDVSVAHAEDMHETVVGEAKKQAGEHVEQVDWETGEILSKWDVYKAGVVKRFKETNEESIADFKAFGTNFDEEWTKFNDKAKTKVDAWKSGVKKRFKETNEDSLADFKRWGTNFDEEWTNFNDKAKEKVDEYKAGVKRRFKETNEESLADFKRWGGNLKDWAGDAKKDIMKTFDNLVEGAKKLPGRIGSGISSMASKVTDGVKKVSNKLASGLGVGVNGVIGGINWVLGKVGSSSHIDEWDVPQYAHGTKGHPGGPAIVGDGIGSNAGSELIQTPNGKISLSPPKDTIVDLPKGTQVLSAKKTKELLGGLPKYANGIGDMLGGLWQGTKNLGKKAVSAAFDIWDYVKSPNKLLNVALGALGISSPKGGSFVGNMAKGGFTKAKDAAIEYVKGKLSDFEESNAGSGQGFGSPFRLTSKRGWRIHPITGRRTFHQGDDWGAPQGTRIPSQSMGTVVFSGYQPSRGNTIRIRSGAYEHLYQHNSRNSVGVGQVVRRGQTVGLVGSTGDSTGPHLHHELKKNGMNINPQGFADGALIKKAQLAMIGEGDKEEVIIPVGDTSKRTNAMKLLALAAKKLGVGGSGSGSTSPSQLPNQNGSDSQVVELLKQQVALLQTLISNPQLINVQVPINNRLVANETYEIIEGKINMKKNIGKRGRGG